MKRVFVLVLDGVGAGELPDAAEYGDTGSHTLLHVAQAVGGLNVPALQSLGLGNLMPLPGVLPEAVPRGSWGLMREASPGKDSVTGHWEMMGVLLKRAFPTYPKGFPQKLVRRFEDAIGTRVLGNVPASGTEIIQRLGEEHLRTGYPILYTSADSVFQVAAHEDVVPVERLYEMCRIARAMLAGEHAVGRVIARPFHGTPGNFRRTERRKDFPLDPPPNILDVIASAGMRNHAIGKIHEFFAGRSLALWDDTRNNAQHAEAVLHAVRASDASFVFANFEDFDMLYGHRNDPHGFARALEEFDAHLARILDELHPEDLLMLTSDHGNDPVTPSTDHSREHAFLLVYGLGLRRGVDLGVRRTFADLGATVLDALGLPSWPRGRSFFPLVAAGG
ncbi:MAG: phosphopentomutase [Chthonomonadales bacterium]